MDVTIPDSLTVNLPMGAGTVTIDLTQCATVMRDMLAMGAQQALGDLNSNKAVQEAEPDAKAALIQSLAAARIAAWYSGTWAMKSRIRGVAVPGTLEAFVESKVQEIILAKEPLKKGEKRADRFNDPAVRERVAKGIETILGAKRAEMEAAYAASKTTLDVEI